MRHLTLLCLATILLSISACNGNEQPPMIPETSQQASTQHPTGQAYENNRNVWGMYEIYYDPAMNSAEVIPVRTATAHWNALRWLEGGPCLHCVEVVSVTPMPSGTTQFGVKITHPFSNQNFTGFDVRGIAMFNGSHQFPACGHLIPDRTAGTGEVVNADGWTALMTPWTNLGGAPELQGYIKGNFASDTAPLASLNAYKRYYSPGTNPRNIFKAGTSIIRPFEIDMPDSAFIFGYAVDGCWAPPTNKPVDDPEEDFPGDANCAEAYRVETTQDPVGQGLHETGGAVYLNMDIYDYTPGSVQDIFVECPEIFDGEIKADWMGFKPDWIGQARALIVNEKHPAVGEYECLIRVVDEEDASSPAYLDLTNYQVVTLTVVEDNLYGFARTWGGTGQDSSKDVAADNVGNVYVTGGFRGSVDFDPSDAEDLHETNGDLDCFLAKYDTMGEFQWAVTWGGPSIDSTNGIAIDESTGLIYVCGHFMETVDFCTDPDFEVNRTSQGFEDGFISRFGPDSSFSGAMWIQGPENEDVENIDVDASGYPVATGICGNGVTFHPSDDAHATNGGDDIFVARYYPDFTLDWSMFIGSEYDDEARDIVYDDLGDVIFCGAFRNNSGGVGIDFKFGSGTDIHTAAGQTDAFLIKLTSAGSYEWGINFGGTSEDGAYSLCDNKFENIFVVGGFKGTADFDPGSGAFEATSEGDFDAFLCKYGSDGAFSFARTWGGIGDDRVMSVAANSSGNPVTTGFFQGTVDFDGSGGVDEISSNGSYDVFITKYQLTSSYLWTRTIGSTGSDTSSGIAIGELTNIYTVGGFIATPNFAPPSSPPDLHTTTGMADCFLVKHLSNGDW